MNQAAQAGSFALVAGEASGDKLGGPLIEALAARAAGLAFLRRRGSAHGWPPAATSWFPVEELAVMGLAEIVRHLPRLLRAAPRPAAAASPRRRPTSSSASIRPSSTCAWLRADEGARACRTVQYVSPQVWAWRQGRVRTIGRSVDLVLCVLPFEAAFYRCARRAAREFVGHPLADRIAMTSDRGRGAGRARTPRIGTGRRRAAGQPHGGGHAAGAAVRGHGRVAAQRNGRGWCSSRRWRMRQRAPSSNAASPSSRRASRCMSSTGGRSECMAASDAVLLASGTATLEAALVKRPMVVAYRVAPLTNWLLRRFGVFKAEHFALPNLLAARRLVPELFQDDVRPEVLGPAVLGQIDRPDRARTARRLSWRFTSSCAAMPAREPPTRSSSCWRGGVRRHEPARIARGRRTSTGRCRAHGGSGRGRPRAARRPRGRGGGDPRAVAADRRPRGLESAVAGAARGARRDDPRSKPGLGPRAGRTLPRSTRSTSCRPRCWRCAARSPRSP